MAFKLQAKPSASLDSPESLAYDLRARKIPGPLGHQTDVLRDYIGSAADAAKTPDVAIQLPTGSGKTYVGLLIGEWRRRKFGERVVYLCPTNQLVNQAVEQANQLYGMRVVGFTGSQAQYAPEDKSAFVSGEALAITSYSALFNTNPFFRDPHSIVLDDAHAAEQYIAKYWSVRVNRKEHATAFDALVGFLAGLLPATDLQKLVGPGTRWDYGWVEKVATPLLAPRIPELVALLDAETENTDLQYPWGVIRDHIAACHLYVGSREILLRPLIPPTSSHKPFADAKQRVYMSATLGAGGELERLTGRRTIHRLSVPRGWDKQGIGRRLFVFPESSLSEAEVEQLRADLMLVAKRSLVIVPDDLSADGMRAWVKDKLKLPTFGPKELEKSKQSFVSTPSAVAVVANRYDGIDFKEEECRLLFIDGLPRAMNLQERFLVSRLGAGVLLDDRILTRVVQAFGRCTRTPTDYAAVVITDEELHTYLLNRDRRGFMHPELQAELEFGIEQSRAMARTEFAENVRIFLMQSEEWRAADDAIVSRRASLMQVALPGTDDLRAASSNEIDYQQAIWQHDYAGALEHARKVLTALTSSEVKPYRALWFYLAGSAAWLAAENGDERLRDVAASYFGQAAGASYGVRWLHALSRLPAAPATAAPPAARDDDLIVALVERLESRLEKLGTVHDRRFDREEREILDNLAQREAKKFERGHELLGRMLGYDAGNKESSAAPDPWWIVDETFCFIFEDHSNAEPDSTLGADKTRQAVSHPKWVHAELAVRDDATVIPVLISPVLEVDRGAVPHLEGLYYWNIDEFRKWAKAALSTIRELRRTFTGAGDLVWRAQAISKYREASLNPDGIRAQVRPAPNALAVRGS
jgi:hypothetical protein